jgi:hypothetical protein
MTQPWLTFPRMRPGHFDNVTLRIVDHLMRLLGNRDAMEKIFILRTKGAAPLRYGSSSPRAMGFPTFQTYTSFIQPDQQREWIWDAYKNERLTYWFMDAETRDEQPETMLAEDQHRLPMQEVANGQGPSLANAFLQ